MKIQKHKENLEKSLELLKNQYAQMYEEWKNHSGCSIFEIRELESKIEEMSLEILPIDKKYFNEYLYTDVQAYKCVKEYTLNKVGVIRLVAKITEESQKKLHESFIPGGFCGHFENNLQEYEYSMPEYKEEDIIILRKHKDGRYYQSGNCCPFVLSDTPEEFFDYNF